MDVALRVESRWFAKILRSPEAAAMIRTLFVSVRELNKGARRPKIVPTTNLKTVGVIGAGFMGAGIAYVTAMAGLNVVLIDRDQEAADKGKAHSAKLMAKQIDRGLATMAERDALLARISATSDYGVVVEAVLEDRKVNACAVVAAERSIGEGASFRSDAATVPMFSLAEMS